VQYSSNISKYKPKLISKTSVKQYHMAFLG
jgi:hypothetical protein